VSCNKYRYILTLLTEHTYTMLQTKPNAKPLAIDSTNASVTFEDVNFEYVSGQKILNSLSFTVPAGQKVAIVGGSGSGWVPWEPCD